MKKIIFALTFIFGVSAVAQAQYKPEGGEKNLEVNFAPLGGTPVSLPFGLKFRSFSGNNTALRLGVFVGYDNTKTLIAEELTDDDNLVTQLEQDSARSNFAINIQPGFEKHLTGTDRLSPYWGGVLNIGYSSRRDYSEFERPLGPTGDTELYLADRKTTTPSLNFGLNLLAGVDYYFAEHIYIGAEVGFGFSMMMDLKSKTVVNTTEMNDDNDRYIEVTNETETELNNQTTTNIGPTVVGAIRAGWLF